MFTESVARTSPSPLAALTWKKFLKKEKDYEAYLLGQ